MTTLTPDQQRQISAQYLAGAAPSELARRYRCDPAEINAALTATATPRRKRGGAHGYQSRAEMKDAIAARNARILTLATEGRTVTEIMADVGLQRAAVCKVLRTAHGARATTTDAEIVAARRAGVTVKAIVETLHAAHRRVTRVLAAAGLAYAAPDLASRTAEILRRRRAGEGPKAIAAALGLAESTVYRALRGASDLPSLYRGAATRKKAKAPKKAKPAPRITPLDPDHRPPVLLDRPFVPTPTPATAPTMITHRTCPHCKVSIRVTNWADHQEVIHGHAKRHQTAEDAPAVFSPRPEPQRPPEPPCPVCRRSPCEAPTSHGRITRMRDQHHYQPRSRP